MNFESARSYCLEQHGAIETFPFDPVTHVMRIGGKMFAILSVDEGEGARISLKCEPTLAEILREQYPAVIPGYHLNKRLWNTISLDGSVPKMEIQDWIESSYDLIVASLTKAQRESIG